MFLDFFKSASCQKRIRQSKNSHNLPSCFCTIEFYILVYQGLCAHTKLVQKQCAKTGLNSCQIFNPAQECHDLWHLETEHLSTDDEILTKATKLLYQKTNPKSSRMMTQY